MVNTSSRRHGRFSWIQKHVFHDTLYTEHGELHHTKDTHFACPIPLFDLAGNFIMPYAVNEMLRGTIVFIRFNLVAKLTTVGMLSGCLPDLLRTLIRRLYGVHRRSGVERGLDGKDLASAYVLRPLGWLS
jgi:hypothetical protein